MYSKFINSLIFFVAFFAVSSIGQNVYDYNNQVCCNGAVFNTTKNLQCCGKKYLKLNKSQICCNNVVAKIPTTLLSSGNYGCCGSTVYDYSNSICCNNVAIPNPKSSQSLSCCGKSTYDYSTQVCCSDTGKVLNIPKSNCPGSLYFSCCGDKLIGPNQQCCNGVAINPSTTLVTDSSGGYSYNSTSFCCQGGGIVQNPNKEACCGNTVIASNGPNSACCGGVAYDSSAQMCCGKTIYSNNGLGCCGNALYDYNSQICCNGVPVNQTSPSLSCCSSNGGPVIIFNRK